MASLWKWTAVVLIISTTTVTAQGVSQLTFPTPRSTSNYVKMESTLPNDLSSLSLCVNVRSTRSSYKMSLVSYAVGGHDNEILLYKEDSNTIHIFIDHQNPNYVVTSPLNVWDGAWHVICATWRNSDGAWQLYSDGVLEDSGTGLAVGGTVTTGGTWILGQDQDSLGGGFDANQAFEGDISQVNLWDRVLSAEEIQAQEATPCDQHGNVIDWAATVLDEQGQVTSVDLQCEIAALTLDDAGIGHLTVSWTEGSLPISRYRLRYQPADGSSSYQDLSPAPAAGVTSTTVSGLLPETSYNITLTSFGEDDQPNEVISGTYRTDSVVVNVECDQDSMAISIPLAALLAVDVANMHLLDTDCGATVDEVNGIVTLETNLQQCDTIQETSGDDKFIFSNEAIANQVTHANGAVRNQPISLPFQCEFLRQYSVSQGGDIMYNIPSPRIQIVDANNTFTMEMLMYTSTDFSATYESSDYPIQVTPSDRLNFGLSVTSPLDNLELFARDCVSTPTTDPNATPRVNIIDDGCEIDDTLEKDTDRSNDKALYFMVDAFTFPNALDPSLVYFHCTMIICFKDDPDSRCKQGCIPAARRRRAVSDGTESRVRRESSRDHAADMTQGPFKIEFEDAAAAGAPVGAVVGAVVGVVGMALLIVAVVLVKKRGGLPMGSKKRDDDTVGQDNYAFQAWGKTNKTGTADTKA